MAGKSGKAQTQEAAYALSERACDEIAAHITAFCEELKIDRKLALRYRLSAEECLLYWLANGGEGKPVRLRTGFRMRAPFILLEAEGAPADPYRGDAEDFGPYCGSVLSNLRLAPEYSYEGGCNRLLFRMRRKKPGQITTLALVIAFAALVGSLGLAVVAGGFRWLRKKNIAPFPLTGLALMAGGALGNMPDRLIRGFVPDMIETLFISFPGFNIADSCLTVGCILVMISLLCRPNDWAGLNEELKMKNEE